MHTGTKWRLKRFQRFFHRLCETSDLLNLQWFSSAQKTILGYNLKTAEVFFYGHWVKTNEQFTLWQLFSRLFLMGV